MNSRKIAGLVCEYNPFHTGHEYQIRKLRELGYEKIVCVMSGNTVQRGEFPITDKYSRAKMALSAGADLVLELPYPYSSSGAEFFASAAVRILSAAGVGTLCFGSECADIDALKRAASLCEGDQFSEAYKDIAGVGVGSATSFFEAYTHVSGESFPGGSNDLLGVAYIRAIIRNKLNIDPIAIKREGSAYNDGELTSESGYPSALMIRNALGDGLGKIEKCLPEKAYEILPTLTSLTEEWEETVTAALSPEEKELFLNMLKRVTKKAASLVDGQTLEGE